MPPSDSTSTVFRSLFLAAILLGTPVLAGSALAHQSTCNLGSVSTQIHLPSTPTDQSSVTEYVQFTLLHRTPLENAAFDARNNVDAYIHDLGCHSPGLFFDLEGYDKLDLYALEAHFYNHQGFDVGDTPCQDTAFDDETVPETTQYVVVVACQGAPANVSEGTVPLPYTVEIDLDVHV